jgi:caffeoyl-CoA O-methyltransferase
VGRRVAALIQLLVRAVRPGLIVELGTATGYSGIWLLRGWPTADLITFEVDEARAMKARRNFAEAGFAERVDVRVENAIEGLGRLPGSAAAFVFNDLLNGLRDEERVEQCFRASLKVLAPGGLLLADNALAGGDVVRRETVEGRCVHRWNVLVGEHPALSSMIVPADDGLSLAIHLPA